MSRREKQSKEELSGPWREIQGAIWLIGLAILFWQNWFWPGILVIMAISAIFEAVVRLVIKPEPIFSETASNGPVDTAESPSTEQQTPAIRLPSRCPNCGAPISEDVVVWSQNYQHASCPYCKSNIIAPA